MMLYPSTMTSGVDAVAFSMTSQSTSCPFFFDVQFLLVLSLPRLYICMFNIYLYVYNVAGGV
jgi:hypothetical protein